MANRNGREVFAKHTMPRSYGRSSPRVITVASTKGGVGKTTLTANLGGLLVDLGQRVLLIDCDVQPTLSSYYGLASRAPHGLVEVLTTGETAGAISRTTVGADIILSNDPDGQLTRWVMETPDGRYRLKRILGCLSNYDIILIDTQGARGALQDMAVLAADVLISPIPPELLSAREFVRGTLGMLERLSDCPLGTLYGLLYRMDRTTDARITAEALRRTAIMSSQGRIHVLETVVPAAVAYRDAASARQPIHRWNPRRQGAAPCGLEVMLGVLRELPLGLEAAAVEIPAFTQRRRGT